MIAAAPRVGSSTANPGNPDSVVVTSTHWAVDAAVPLPERAVVEVARDSLEVTVHDPAPLGGRGTV